MTNAGKAGTLRTVASKRPTPSAAERALRKATPDVVRRVENGATVHAALGMSGYTRQQTRTIIRIADGGEADVTDAGYRRACELLRRKVTVATAEQEERLHKRWRELAYDGDDWRAIAELLKRRNPDEWAVTERSEVAVDASVNVRSDDAVLDALRALRGETATGDGE